MPNMQQRDKGPWRSRICIPAACSTRTGICAEWSILSCPSRFSGQAMHQMWRSNQRNLSVLPALRCQTTIDPPSTIQNGLSQTYCCILALESIRNRPDLLSGRPRLPQSITNPMTPTNHLGSFNPSTRPNNGKTPQ